MFVEKIQGALRSFALCYDNMLALEALNGRDDAFVSQPGSLKSPSDIGLLCHLNPQ